MAAATGKIVKAAVLNKFGTHLDIEELTLERPEPGEVMVRVAFCSLCHSDIHSFMGAF